MVGIEETELYKAFLPFCKFLQSFGLCHSKKHYSEVNSVETPRVSRKKFFTCSVTKSQCYSLIVVSVMTANSIRLFTMFHRDDFKFGFELFMKICYTAWFLYVTLNAIISYRGSTLMSKFFLEEHKFQEEFRSSATATRNHRRVVKIVLGTCVLFTVVNAVFITLFGIVDTTSVNVLLTPFEYTELPAIEEGTLKTFVVITVVFGTVAWIAPMGIYFFFGRERF